MGSGKKQTVRSLLAPKILKRVLVVKWYLENINILEVYDLTLCISN